MTAAPRCWVPAAPGAFSTRHAGFPDDDRLFVERADPLIWIAAELADQLRGRSSDDARHRDVTFVGPAAADDVTGWVLTVDAVNQRVVYVVRRYLFEMDCWEAEWPD